MKCRTCSTRSARAVTVISAAGVSALVPVALAAPARPSPARPTAAIPAAATSAARAVAAPGAVAATGAVAAEVNRDKILVADVDRMLAAIRESEPSLATDSPSVRSALQTWRQRILENLITQRLLYQEAVRREIVPAAADVDKGFQELKGQFKDDAEFKAALAQEGVTPQHVREGVIEELAIRELTRQLTADITVSQDEMGRFYRENPKEFTIPEGLRVRHILLAVKPDAKPADRQKVLARSKDLLKKAQVGNADFAALARDNSDDTGSKDKGGDLGRLQHERWVKPFEDAAFEAPVGKVVGPVETDFGYHLIKVEKAEAHTVPLAEVKDDLKLYLLQKKAKERLDQRIAALRAQAAIKKNI